MKQASTTDLLLLLEHDVASLQRLHEIADRLGCDRIDVGSLSGLHNVLSVRRPTLAVIAIDGAQADGLSALQAVAEAGARPATLLVGSVDDRVMTSARRAAEARGIRVIGGASRPLDGAEVERLLTAQLAVPPPVSRAELAQALDEHQLTLYYQPQIALQAGGDSIQAAEALVRWHHPRRGLLHPRHFLDAFEHHGLLTAMTDFVLTEAVRQMGTWQQRGLPLRMIVNLSPRLVRDRAFPERLATLLREQGVPPQQIMLDVTEAPAHAEGDLLLDVFTRLRILGVGLALDNFGTGLSSLTELYRLPFSEIKVDHSLIADVLAERDAQTIVRAIVNLAHSLGLSACAEGVETREQLTFVRSVGFDSAQGQLFCGPEMPDVVEKLVSVWPESTVNRAVSGRPAEEPTVEIAGLSSCGS